MKKRLFALFCALVLTVSAVPFADALQGESLRAADTLATLNLVRGDHELDAHATRAQAAVLLVRLAGAEQAAVDMQAVLTEREIPEDGRAFFLLQKEFTDLYLRLYQQKDKAVIAE